MKILNKYYPIRTDIPVANPFEIINTVDPEEFHIVLYHIDDENLKLIARQLDTVGWKYDLQINLYSQDKTESELITIGPCDEDAIIKNFTTKIKLIPVNLVYEQKIPKIIVQTTNTYEMDTLLYNSVMTLLELNPEYEYELYDAINRRKFIKDHFEEDVLNTYDLLVPGAYKADLFRYCYIFINGGCYFDFKSILKMPLRNLIEHDRETVLCQDLEPNGYSNAIILAVAKNIHVKDVIDECVKRIKNYYFGLHKTHTCLWLTGPELLYSLCKEIHPLIVLKDLGKHLHDYNVLRIADNSKVMRLFHKTYRSNYIKTYGLERYPELWEKDEVIYQDRSSYENIIFFVYPHTHPDKFTFTLTHDYLYVQRVDNSIGWEQNLRVKVIDDLENTETLLDIGKSIQNIRIFPRTNISSCFRCPMKES